jgi:hypothetical protein
MKRYWWLIGGLVLCAGCQHELDRTKVDRDAELRAGLLGTWRLFQNRQILAYNPDGSFVDSCWVYPSGNPEDGHLIIVTKGLFVVRDGIVYRKEPAWEVVSPTGRPGKVSILTGPSKVSISGDTMYSTPVSVYTSDSALARDLYTTWTAEEMLYTGPPEVVPNGYRGRVRTTLVFSDSGTWKQTVEYPDRQPMRSKSQGGTFTYAPPLLWMSGTQNPARVEISQGAMIWFAFAYPEFSLRVPDSLRTRRSSTERRPGGD